MSKKRVLIILVVILVVSATVLSLFNMFRTKNQPLSEISQEKETVSGQLPISNQESRPFSEAEIQRQFNIFKNNSTAKKASDGFLHIEMVGPEKNPIPLHTVMPALNIKLSQEISELLSPLDYQFFSCYSQTKPIGWGIGLAVGNPDKTSFTKENLDEEMIYRIRNWESRMFPDLHTILFPDMLFSPSELSQNIVFKDGSSRYADINLPYGERGSINYLTIGYSIFISNSVDCLKKGASELFMP